MKENMIEEDDDVTVTVKVSRTFGFSAEEVYDAWLTPLIARRFFFATPDGEMVRADIDARVGGHFVFTDKRDGEEIEHHGTYLALDRPRRISFSFYVPKFQDKDDSTTITLDIAHEGKSCTVNLTHDGVWEDYAERTEQGWAMILEGLEKAMKA